MIGNDVIDLAATRKESNWQRTGFLEKLFSPAERKIISTYSSPEVMVWILWSMKEAAYKIYNRQTKRREFIPQQLLCSITAINDIFTGEVRCNGFIYYSKTVLKHEFIHTIALTCTHDMDKVNELENNAVFKDEWSIPYIYSDKNSKKPVSVSHHGRFSKTVVID
jgi:phosphopantetheinyl transferase (holo-ACP synthase)